MTVLAAIASNMEKHPDKTFIGRIERGFDFPGYHLGPAGLRLAKQTLADFIEKASRLYEQEREEPDGSSELRRYLTRWLGWARGGLDRRTDRRRDNMDRQSRARTTRPSAVCAQARPTRPGRR